MDPGVSWGELALVIGALLLAGSVTGLLAGMLGIGGGGILLPALYELFGALGVDDAVRMHLAVGTSLAVIVPTSIRSFLAHRARGAVDGAAGRSRGRARRPARALCQRQRAQVGLGRRRDADRAERSMAASSAWSRR
ncbi:MAG TPA: TSUP family transporter [Geminicoccaceae bacterium]|jgi:hypothetical protein|nr:TSUP family transporter [Geminicoccaceae bacterium]